MKRILLLSDTHNYLDETIFEHGKICDEIWHAGDFGNDMLAEKLRSFKPTRGVYGNIDGPDVKANYPEKLHFNCEGIQVFMKHIGGYPGRYAPGVKQEILTTHPQLFISGHSHILKIMFDDKTNCLHMNPGAAGKQGWHTVRTMIRFVIEGKDMKDCEVIELG